MAKTRKIPLRKSVVSGQVIDKRDLLRIVKNKEGQIFIDPTGKKNGRGAYIKLDNEEAQLAKKRRVFNHSFSMESACLAGEVPQAILAGDYERAKATALWYRDLFGEGNYYIELQDHGLEEDNIVLPQLIKLARETGIPMAATNDSHYLRKEDAKMQAILLCIQTGKTIQDADRMEFQTDEFYVKTTDEMYDLFSMVPEACENTAKIAEQCNFDFEFGHTKIPYYKAPDGMDNQAFFEKLCWEGLERRYGPNVPQANKDRLSYEIGVVKTMGYTNYYLIVWDYINYAKSQGIPVGPGRGSGAGSIAAYSVGITDIDPIRYNLIFERFLNPERVSNYFSTR